MLRKDISASLRQKDEMYHQQTGYPLDPSWTTRGGSWSPKKAMHRHRVEDHFGGVQTLSSYDLRELPLKHRVIYIYRWRFFSTTGYVGEKKYRRCKIPSPRGLLLQKNFRDDLFSFFFELFFSLVLRLYHWSFTSIEIQINL